MRSALFRGPALALLVSATTVSATFMSPADAQGADTSVPVLLSFAVSDTSVSPGETVSATYSASDEAGSLSCVIFSFNDPVGGNHQVRSDGSVPLSGSVSATVPESWPNGPAQLVEITLCDPSQNQIRYARDGTTWKFPSGAGGPSTHSFNFAPGDLTISGSTADTTMPTLVSFTVAETNRRTSAPNNQVTINYATTDDSQQPLSCLIFSFTDPIGGNHQIRQDGAVSLTGTLTGSIDTSWPLGTSPLVEITMCDKSGNQIRLARDGSTWKFPNNATGPVTHSFDFRPGDLSIAELPAAPTAATATAKGDLAAEVTWTTPSNTGGAEITGYTITASPDGQTTTVPGDQTTAHLTGLTAGTATSFTVVATNWVGNSPASAPSTTVQPGRLPSSPADVTAEAKDSSVAVTWAPSTDENDPVTGYTVTATPQSSGAPARTATYPGTANSATISGLTNGMAYAVSVTATNRLGDSVSSTAPALVTPVGPPGRVGLPGAKVTKKPGKRTGTIAVTWKSPVTGGTEITAYRIRWSGGRAITKGSDSHRAVFRRVPSGRYTFRVSAINEVGAGRASPKLVVRVK